MSTLATAFDAHEALYREQVHQDTWGHLMPEQGRAYPGTLLFAKGVYRDVVVIRSDFGDLDGGPWFYDHVHDYIHDHAGDEGTISRFTGTYRMLKNGKGRFVGKIVRVTI